MIPVRPELDVNYGFQHFIQGRFDAGEDTHLARDAKQIVVAEGAAPVFS